MSNYVSVLNLDNGILEEKKNLLVFGFDLEVLKRKVVDLVVENLSRECPDLKNLKGEFFWSSSRSDNEELIYSLTIPSSADLTFKSCKAVIYKVGENSSVSI